MPTTKVHNVYIVNRKTGKRHCVSDLEESDYKPADESLCQDFGASGVTAPEQPPPKVDLRQWMTKVEDQEPTQSCTANAIAGACEYLLKRATGQEIDVSRLFVYYNARKRTFDIKKKRAKITDNGSGIGVSIETLKLNGVCVESIWPFAKEKKDAKPSPDSYAGAKEYIFSEAIQVGVDLNQIKTILAKGLPIVFGLKLFTSFDKAQNNGGVVSVPDASEAARKQHKGHAMLLVGYSDSSQAFIVRNSWGDKWGDKGYCHIPYDYITNPKYASHMYAIKPMSELDLGTDHWSQEDQQNLLEPHFDDGEEPITDDDIGFLSEDEDEEYFIDDEDYQDEDDEEGGVNEGDNNAGDSANPEE